MTTLCREDARTYEDLVIETWLSVVARFVDEQSAALYRDLRDIVRLPAVRQPAEPWERTHIDGHDPVHRGSPPEARSRGCGAQSEFHP